MSKRVVLLTDLDNTLYDFVGYFAPCFRAMLHALSRILALSEEALLSEFRTVYERRGTVEYAFSVQELASVRRLVPRAQDEAVHVARVAFGQTRRKRLRLYRGVLETLRWINGAGGRLCAITNAPAYHAYMRLRHLGIEGLFDVMGAWEGVLVPQEYQEAGQRYLRKYREMDGRLDLSIRADKGLIKPSPSMVEEVCQYLSDPRAVFFVVGDSVRKDLAPCRSLDITTIWAKYGQRTDEKDQATLDSITPWTKEEFALHYDAEFEPDYTIGSFEELRDILPIPYQQRLL